MAGSSFPIYSSFSGNENLYSRISVESEKIIPEPKDVMSVSKIFPDSFIKKRNPAVQYAPTKKTEEVYGS